MSEVGATLDSCCENPPVWIMTYSNGVSLAVCAEDYEKPRFRSGVVEIVNIATQTSYTPEDLFYSKKQSVEIEQIQLILDLWYISYSLDFELFLAVTDANTIMTAEMIGQINNLGLIVHSIHKDGDVTRVYFRKRVLI